MLLQTNDQGGIGFHNLCISSQLMVHGGETGKVQRVAQQCHLTDCMLLQVTLQHEHIEQQQQQASVHQGPNFTSCEDLLITKARIHSNEVSTAGAKMKSGD